ncbi:hypothetical protein F5884DRAFT_784787 [Xylogone sp. PMI_703]|nr:hypothetical protein F5884DRAFT_784787 [Xylogone sp. PMI_703]
MHFMASQRTEKVTLEPLVQYKSPKLADRTVCHGSEYPLSFHKRFYFFYGSLIDPGTLKKVLGLHEWPRLFPGKITGYHCMIWGEYPVLLDGEPHEVVYGMAYEVTSLEAAERLEHYETTRYEVVWCDIEFEDGTQVAGKTFKWADDLAELKVGTFDLRDWKLDRLDRDALQ